MLKIKRDTLEIVQGFNGYYLYGFCVNTNQTEYLGCLGDGSDDKPTLANSYNDYAEAYGFELV